jgi:Tfp pilus assembly protein PilF
MRRDVWKLWLGVALGAAVYMALRLAVLPVRPGDEPPLPLTGAGLGRDVLAALGFYAEAILWPRAAGVLRTVPPPETGYVVAGAVALVAWMAGLAWGLRRRARIATWALLWMGLGFVPPLVLLLRTISETRVAGRYAYLPAAAAALLLALAVPRVRPRPAVLAVLGAVLVVVAAVTAQRASIWRDNVTFWRNAVAAVPYEGYAHERLARALQRLGDERAAEEEFRRALELRLLPANRVVVQNNFGYLLLGQSRYDEAEPIFAAAVAAKPRLPGPYRGLAECRWERARRLAHAGREIEARGMLPDVEALLRRAIEIEPAAARSAYLLGRVQRVLGDRAEAERWFTYAMKAAPGTETARQAQAELAALDPPP